MRDWRTDEQRAADARDRPYLMAEAWSVGIVMAIGLLLSALALFGLSWDR